MKNFKNLIKQANKEIEKVIKFIEENEKAFYPTNLKLYDIHYNDEIQSKYDLNDEEYNVLFNDFCQLEFEMYEEWKKEEKLQNKHKYIGRTSSFYFHDEDIVQLENDRIDLGYSISGCIAKYINGFSDLQTIINKDGLLDIDLLTDMLKTADKYYIDGYIEEMKTDLINIIHDSFYKEIISDLKDTITDYNYINEFKQNQVSSFENHIENNRGWIEVA